MHRNSERQGGLLVQGGTARSRRHVMERLAEVLIERDLVSRDRLEELQHRAHWLDEDLDQLLMDERVVPADVVYDALGAITGFPVASMVHTTVEEQAVAMVPDRVAALYHVMPIRFSRGTLTLATSVVYDIKEEDKLRVLLGAAIEWVLCPAEEIAACVKHYYGVGVEALLGVSFPGDRAAERGESGVESDSVRDVDAGDITGFVRQIIGDAARSGASDIHFEPEEDGLRLRYRIDGVMYRIPMPREVNTNRKAVVSSVKVMAQMDITDRRMPQDGRFTLNVDGEALDIRVSCLPSHLGEAVNLRILNRGTTFRDMSELGLGDGQFLVLQDLLGLQNGVILFVGPTGSGKTTSLYAAVDRLKSDERKVITIEDPVEYRMQGVVQMQVNSEIGFTFASGLRSLLRHDPDVILVGEIRDSETADIAVSAALTGHLVLSTLHTNDSAGTITRLLDMGVEPYLIASSVKGIVAQRLVRRICRACKEAMELDERVREELHRAYMHVPEDAVFYQGRGCPACRFTGYSGRQAIFEVLVMTDEVRALVVERASSSTIMRRGIDQGLVTLRSSGWQMALEGVTTVDDVLRVTRYQAARQIVQAG